MCEDENVKYPSHGSPTFLQSSKISYPPLFSPTVYMHIVEKIE